MNKIRWAIHPFHGIVHTPRWSFKLKHGKRLLFSERYGPSRVFRLPLGWCFVVVNR